MQRKANIKNASEHIFAKILHSNTDVFAFPVRNTNISRLK